MALRSAGDLPAAAARKGTQELHGVRHGQHLEVGPDRGLTDLRLPTQLREAHKTAARPQQQAQEGQEADAADPGQLQDVAGEEAVEPLGVEGRIGRIGEEHLGQAAMHKPPIQVGGAGSVGALLPQHRAEVKRHLAPGEGVANLPVAASVAAPIARMRRPGRSSAAIFSSMPGSASRCTSSRTSTARSDREARNPSGSASRRWTEGRSQLKYSTESFRSSRSRERVVLPTRRTPRATRCCASATPRLPASPMRPVRSSTVFSSGRPNVKHGCRQDGAGATARRLPAGLPGEILAC